jgi:hypothetical protein
MDKLGDFNFKKVHENNQCELFYIEGRYFPKINQKKTLLLGIDGRNTTWVKQGREELSKNFDAKIDLCVGFSVATEGYLKLKKKKEFKDCLKALCNSSGEGFYPDEDIDKQWMRIDIALCAASDKVMDSLEELSRIFAKNKAQFRVARFSGKDGIVEGNLDDDGDFFGPAAYAKASWDVEVMRTETIRITVNDAEVLFDGDEIVF